MQKTTTSFQLPNKSIIRKLILIFLMIGVQKVSATVYYVSTAGNNSNAGTSWATAVQSVQVAIIMAFSGDEIWIKAGTYYPITDVSGNTAPVDNRTKTFLMASGVSIYGGFAGTETSRNQRSPAANPVILSGDLGTLGTTSDNAYHVVCVSNPTATTMLDGVIIRDGNANLNTTATFLGISSIAATNFGGGLFIAESSGTPNSNFFLNNCKVLSNNSGTGTGNGSGGAIFSRHMSATITNCLFASNTCAGLGGAISFTGASPTGSPSLSRCIFANNTSNGNGGAVATGLTDISIQNCLFVSNTSSNFNGGAVFGITGVSSIINSTFYNNSAAGATSGGGAIALGTSGTSTLTNLILSNNSTPNNSTDAGQEEIARPSGSSTTTVSYSCVRDAFPMASYVTNGGNNFTTAPTFVNSSDADGADNIYFSEDDGFNPTSSSSVINAGTSTGAPTSDILGHGRIGNTDIGAYELFTGKVRWVNNSGSSRPSNVTVNSVSEPVYPFTYTSITGAVNAAQSGDIVYVTNGNYRNPKRLTSTNCAIAGILGVSGSGGQDTGLYINVKTSNILITSETGNYATSSANLFGYGFNIMASTNITIRGFNMDSIRVNGFYNSNGYGFGPTTRVRILKNKVKNTFGHGVKTDSDGFGSINRRFWQIDSCWFENIGFYTHSSCSGSNAVTAIWLAEAGDTCNIINNTIINTKWAGFLCTGFGSNTGSATAGKLTVTGNKVSKCVDAGIQIGFPLSPAFYYPNNAEISNNYITEANTHNELGIGAITMLYNELKNVKITGNHMSNSYNGLAIDISGWQSKTDTTEISGNNFCGLVAGSYAVTHKAGYGPNCLCTKRDDLAKYKFKNNYWGSPCGPKYPSNPGGNGERLRRDSTIVGSGPSAGQHFSENDFNFTPFATTPFTIAAAGGASCGSTGPEINVKGNAVTILDGDVTPVTTDSTDFGAVATGTKRRYTIENLGSSALTISSIAVSGTNSADFTVSGAPSSIAAGSSAKFFVTFATVSTGARNATITINNNDCDEAAYDFAITAQLPAATPEINVKGNTISIADGDISPSLTDSTDFGLVTTGAKRRFTIENNGAGALTISSIVLSGVNSADYAISSAPSSVSAGSSAVFYVTFNPALSGTRNATITINNNDADEAVYNYKISASAISISCGEFGKLSNSSSTSHGSNNLLGQKYTFPAGTVDSLGINVVSATGNFVIALYSDASGSPGTLLTQSSSTALVAGKNTVDVPNVTLTGGSYWIMKNISASTNVYGITTLITTHYIPLTYGSTLPTTFPTPTVYTSGSNFDIWAVICPSGPEIDVKGNSVSIVAGDITPSLTDSTDFGTVAAGTKRSFTIENTGSSVLNITSSTVTGANATSFAISGMPSSVAVGASAKFYVTFNPSSSGLKLAQINIFNNDANEGTYDFKIQANQTCLVQTSVINDTMTNASNDSSAFNCANWKSGKYPDSMVNIVILNGAELKIRTNEKLKVHNIFVQNGGKLLMSGGELKVYGNIISEGFFSLIRLDSGKIVLTGTDTNKFSGNIPRFFNVEINKPSGIVFFDGLGFEVSNHIEFKKGIIRYGSGGSLEIRSGATTSQGNPNSFAACEIRAYDVPSTFVFPVGKGNKWARLAIENTSGGIWRCEYFNQPNSISSVLTPLDHISGKEYWDLEPDGPYTVDVKLHWEDAAYSGIDLAQSSSNLVVAHLDGSDWEDAGNAAVTFAAQGSVTSAPFSNFSPFTLGSLIPAIPLSNHFIKTTVVRKNKVNQIAFTVNRDLQGKQFTIERSIGNTAFTSIGTIDCNNCGTQNFTYTDNTSFATNLQIHYRIKWELANGQMVYSPIKSVQTETNLDLSIYPNPSNGNFVLVTSNENKISSISITDAIGRKIEFTQNNAASNKIEIALPKTLSEGIYYLTLINEAGVQTVQEILIQR